MCELHPISTAVMIVSLVAIWLWANVKLAKVFETDVTKSKHVFTFEYMDKENT